LGNVEFARAGKAFGSLARFPSGLHAFSNLVVKCFGKGVVSGSKIIYSVGDVERGEIFAELRNVFADEFGPS
jgi:hypothetical protein